MTSPMTRSRCARVCVSCAAWVRMSLIVPPCPWKTVISDWAMVLTYIRVKGFEERFEAADECVEVERGLGAFHGDDPAGHQRCGRYVDGSLFEFEEAVADEVGVADARPRPVIDGQGLVDVERDDDGVTVCVEVDLADLADLDSGGTDELTGPDSAGIAELCEIGVRAIEPQLTEDHDDQRGEGQQDQ